LLGIGKREKQQERKKGEGVFHILEKLFNKRRNQS